MIARRDVLHLAGSALSASLLAGCAPTPEESRPFHLRDQFGREVTDRDILGKPTAMFFGFTYCPEVCPTTLASLTRWLKALGPDGDRLNVVYVTIDPERDTQAQMAKYLSTFDPRIRGLTGTPAEIAQIAKGYRVFYRKVPLEGGAYTMDHTAAIYLLNARGKMTGVIPYSATDAQGVKALRDLLS